MSFAFWWGCVFAAGLALRIALFSGYGLGDDPNFFGAYFEMLRARWFNPTVHYDLRFSFALPVIFFMRVLGIHDVGFVGFVTLCSLINLVLVYMLARQEWERSWALLAMGLAAVFPLEVLCGTLFVIDVPMATYCFAAFWLYRQSLAAPRASSTYAAAAALFLLLAYLAKASALLVGILFAAEALTRRKWRPTLICGGGFALLVGLFMGWQWLRFGSPWYQINLENSIPSFQPYGRALLLDYPEMLLAPNLYGSFFAGFFPHLLLILTLLLSPRLRRNARWPIYFFLLLAALVLTPAHRDNGRWTLLAPHIFRYLALLSVPLCLAVAACLRELHGLNRRAAVALTAALLATSIWQCIAVTRPTRDAFGEERRALRLLRRFPDEKIWADFLFHSRFRNFELLNSQPGRIGFLRAESADGRHSEFQAIQDGLVVTGGGRLPWYGCVRCTSNLAGFVPPPTWELLETLEAPLTPFRIEPLRIWRVHTAREAARQLVSREAPGGDALEPVRASYARGEFAVVLEAAKLLLSSPGTDRTDEVLQLAGMAELHRQKPEAAARYFEQGLNETAGGPRAADIISGLAQAAVDAGNMEQARNWVKLFRERFPTLPTPELFTEIEWGLRDAALEQAYGRMASAERRTRALLARTDAPAAIRRQAHYRLVLALFAQAKTREAVTLAYRYRETYGEDALWTELLFRQAEAVSPEDREAARLLLANVVQRFPGTYWAREARKRLGAQESAENRFHEGFTAYHGGQELKARAIFHELEDDPLSSEELRTRAQYMLCLTLFRLKEWDLASARTEEFLARHPRSAESIELRFRIAESHQIRGNWKEARRRYEAVASNFPDSVWSRYSRERLQQMPE